MNKSRKNLDRPFQGILRSSSESDKSIEKQSDDSFSLRILGQEDEEDSSDREILRKSKSQMYSLFKEITLS